VLNSNNISLKVKTGKKHTLKFGNIIGFGVNFIKMLENDYNIKTIDDLDTYIKANPNKIKLNKMQQIGMKYRSDLQILISRGETEQIFNDILNDENIKVLMSEYKLHVVLAGSYHSGKKESKDIDILVAVPDKKIMSRDGIMSRLVKIISNQNISELCEKNHSSRLITLSQGVTKFMGLLLNKSSDGKCLYRHVDIRLVDYDAYPYARLYFSSGVVFNKLIREKLKKRGYKLNEWCLTHLDSKKFVDFGVKFNDGDNLDKYADVIEKRIFELAELEYKTIVERY
jgi:DNA polymerase/3'-5' exonuclease PolX